MIVKHTIYSITLKINDMDSTAELIRFAKDGNADQCFAILDERVALCEELQELMDDYENAKIDDAELCNGICEFFDVPGYNS